MTIGQRALWVGLAVVSWVSASQAQPLGLEELWRLDRLPAFKTSTSIGSISSYDRTGGNDDGFSGKFSSVRQDPEGVVLADLKGPGIIYRLWTPTPTDDVMEFLFDGETKPRVEVKFRELFLGSHPLFPRPLVGFGVGGYFSYVPIPFARSCVVRVRAKRVQFYQINYALFAPETPLTSFGPEPAATELAERQKVIEVWNQSGGDLSRFTAPPGAKVEVAQRSFTLVPKSSETLFRSDAGGRIVGLRVMPTSALIGKGRDLILRISFDGEEPAVLCPLGDFFGYGWGRPATQSLLVGTSGETNYCYFPMPYNRSARVEILSERSTAVELRTEVLHALKPRQESEGKFYALWRRENPTTLGEPFRFIETKGRGHLVGVVWGGGPGLCRPGRGGRPAAGGGGGRHPPPHGPSLPRPRAALGCSGAKPPLTRQAAVRHSLSRSPGTGGLIHYSLSLSLLDRRRRPHTTKESRWVTGRASRSTCSSRSASCC